MAINKVFKEMFLEQKRQRELQYEKEIIKKVLEERGKDINDFEKALDFLEEKNYEKAYVILKKCALEGNSQAQYEYAKLLLRGLGTEINKEEAKRYLLCSYKNGFKKSGSLLREIRCSENKNLLKIVDTKFENIVSELGYKIDMPNNWYKLDSKNKKCFDTIALDSINNDVIFNIKMQVFLIEIPDNMSTSVSLDRVTNNMGCIDSIDFNNKNCDGKLVCTEGVDGTCNYIFITKGKRGVYDLRIIVDKYLEYVYEDIIDHIIYSFEVLE